MSKPPAPDIWLEPECCGAPDAGQMWCPDNIFDCEDGVDATHYVLASRLEKVEALLEVARCPNCDNCGRVGMSGDQCQWCTEKDTLLEKRDD